MVSSPSTHSVRSGQAKKSIVQGPESVEKDRRQRTEKKNVVWRKTAACHQLTLYCFLTSFLFPVNKIFHRTHDSLRTTHYEYICALRSLNEPRETILDSRFFPCGTLFILGEGNESKDFLNGPNGLNGHNGPNRLNFLPESFPCSLMLPLVPGFVSFGQLYSACGQPDFFFCPQHPSSSIPRHYPGEENSRAC